MDQEPCFQFFGSFLDRTEEFSVVSAQLTSQMLRVFLNGFCGGF